MLDCAPNATLLTLLFYVFFRAGHYLALQPGARAAGSPLSA